MIKFAATNKEDGKLLMGLGLSRGNIDKLTAGNPIQVDLAEVSAQAGIKLEGQLLIFFGETEAQMVGWIEEWIDPDTKIIIDPKLRS